jgi:holliday junction DNA helicase RuvA
VVIARIHGRLEGVQGDHALVLTGGFTYGIHISPWVGEHLVASGMVGGEVTFHTMHYIEGGIGMGNLFPRLVGFLSREDLEFFTLLITVQGLGVRKALRALVIPVGDLANAIERNDLATLRGLPEIGTKTAQKIVMELQGKVAEFSRLPVGGQPVAAGAVGGMEEEYRREAFEVLLQLQYPEAEAREMVIRIAKAHPDIDTSEGLIQEVFRSRAGKWK